MQQFCHCCKKGNDVPSGLGETDNVVASQGSGDSLGLDWRRDSVVELFAGEAEFGDDA